MKRTIKFVCLALALSFIASCNKSEADVDKATLSTDKTAVSVASDNLLIIDPFSTEKPDLTDTIIVSSSRSWTVTVETSDGGEWLFPQTTEHINASGKAEDFPLVLQFDRYKGSVARTAKVSIHAADIEAPVELNVTQQAYKQALEVKAGESTILPSGECTSLAIVKANTEWTAHLDAAESTVNPTLSVVSGDGPCVIELKFPINVSDELAKVAMLVVEAEGCETQKVEFIQKQSKSFFGLEEPVPELVPAYVEKIHIPLLSNGPWSAEISDCTFANAKLSIASGTNCLYGFDFIADHGFDPEVALKKATVTINREGMTSIVVSFSQEGSIHFVTERFNPEYEWEGSIYEEDKQYRPFIACEVAPFSSPETLPTKFDAGTNKGMTVDLVTTNGGFTFTAYGTDCGCWLGTTGVGLAIGKVANDYLMFPAVPGKRLAKMYYQASCVSETPYTVRTADGKIVIKGGEKTWTKFIVPVDGDLYDMHEHIFPETENDVRYRLNLEEDLRYISVKDLCLVYE